MSPMAIGPEDVPGSAGPELEWFYDCDRYGRQTYEAPATGPAPFYLIEGSYGEESGGRCSYGDNTTYEAAVARRDQLIRDGAGPSDGPATVEGQPPYTHWKIERVSYWMKTHDVDGSHVTTTTEPATESES